MKRYLAVVLALLICFSSILTASAATGTWKENSKGKWYEYEDGSYPKDKWLTIDNDKYYFNSNGYAVTGWQQIKNKWYLFDQNGIMLTGWQKVGNYWYYMYKNGEMLTGWQKTDTGFSYLDPDGKWIKDAAYEDSFIFGIDVSKWQGDINWQALKDEGVSFAFVRVGHGDHTIDPKFHANMKGAEKAGIPVGVYYYSEAVNETQALRDAQFVIRSLDSYLVSYPVVIDVEDSGTQGSLSKQQLGKITKTFCDEIEAAGYTPMLYCNESWYKNKIDTSLIPNVYKWVARWSNKYDTDIKRDVWQAGETGKLNGIDGYVDIDFALVDFTKIVTPRREKSDSYIKQTGVWREDNVGRWYSYTAGGWAVGWELIGSDWYYFDEEGYMCTGWINDGNAYYYLETDGAWTGHKKDDITDPAVHTDIISVDEILPTCAAEGVLAHFKCGVCGKLFSDAEATTEIAASNLVIQKLEHTLNHVDALDFTCTTDGNMAYDRCEVCEKIFVDGVEITAHEVILPATHTLEHIAKINPQIEVEGVKAHERCDVCQKLFINGVEVTEQDLIIPALPKYEQKWIKDSKGWWYQYSDGSYSIGWDEIGGKWYYFNANGYMQTGWIKLKNIWYYLEPSGAMQTGWEKIRGIWYYFNQDGAMQTGWQKLSGKWYYMNPSGAMLTAWQTIGGKRYYFLSSGEMVTGNVNIGGKIYRFNSSGALIG